MKAISGRSLRWLIPTLLLTLAVRHWALMPVCVCGDSMFPTLKAGQFAWVNKAAYHFRCPRRGEIVVLNTGRERIVKRIIGLPGEDVDVQAGVFYVSGQPLSEPYVCFQDLENVAPGRLGWNQYLLAGDNRLESVTVVVNGDRLLGPLVTRR
jgi:signal peptidase I